MGALMNPLGFLLALVLAPLGLLGSIGVVLLVLKVVAILHKGAEPPTTDEGGQYSLEQGKDVGKQE
jgi:hypothetical protein